MAPLTSLISEGIVKLGPFLSPNGCRDLLTRVQKMRGFSGELFLSEAEYRKNPQHKGVNPMPGRNLIERFDMDWMEKNPHLVEVLTKVLGNGYTILDKKFVVGVPHSWIPPWLAKEIDGLQVANLGPYVKPDYRDITYFHGIDFHQDIIDYKARLCDFITFYVYLEETDLRTSPLYAIPKSHRFGATTFPHDLTAASGNDIVYGDRKGQSGDLHYETLMGPPAGSCYFWHACTLHGTKPHLADNPRVSLRYLFQKGQNSGACLLDEVNASLAGPLALEETRIDLDVKGQAKILGNNINKI